MWLKRVPYQFRSAEQWEVFGRRGKGLQIHLDLHKGGKEHEQRETVVNFGTKISAGLKESQEII